MNVDLCWRRGRDRSTGVPHAPRTVDLDLLLYGNMVVRDGELTLPHPRMHERRFVLAPRAGSIDGRATCAADGGFRFAAVRKYGGAGWRIDAAASAHA